MKVKHNLRLDKKYFWDYLICLFKQLVYDEFVQVLARDANIILVIFVLTPYP